MMFTDWNDAVWEIVKTAAHRLPEFSFNDIQYVAYEVVESSVSPLNITSVRASHLARLVDEVILQVKG